MAGGTNNGGGPRWANMDRIECPLCGLNKPVGILQIERNGGRCNDTAKCRARLEAKRARQAKLDGKKNSQ